MTMFYKNAAKILPPDFLAKLRKYHTGILWIPKNEDDYKERVRLIRELLRHGVPTAEVAGLAKLTQRRVQQIQREMKISKAKRTHDL